MPVKPARLWLARLGIAVVLAANLQCALAFLAWPSAYAPAFELEGTPGSLAVGGTGLLFLMWNVPYAVALWHPARHRLSLAEAVVMQALGAAGETLLRLNLPPGHAALQASLERFILFDSFGLGLLLLAAWLVRGVPAGKD